MDIAGICVPAKQIGGDYFDFIEKDKLLDIIIADVSGHNIGAALLMAEVRTFIQAQARQLSTPPDVLHVLNRFMYEDLTNAELFITMFYLQYDALRGRLAYANAGHNPPLLLHDATGTFEELDGEGMILGITPEIDFEEKYAYFQPGDILVLYTDGIIETENSSQQMYGMERLKAAITDNSALSAQEIIDNTMNDARMFQGRRHFNDDVTMIVLKINR